MTRGPFAPFVPRPATPLVGRSIKAHECMAVVTATCQCRPDNEPMMIPGVNVVMACIHCRAQYAIVQIAYERVPGVPLNQGVQVQATVAQVGFLPRPDTPSIGG